MPNSQRKNRFGVSAWSKKNYKTAYNEEIMVDKLTGEFLIKTPTGDTISYNYNSRLSSQLTATKMNANNMSIYGDIISIEFDDILAPFIMNFNSNYISSPINVIYPNCKRFMFSIDIDPIVINSAGISHNKNNLNIEISLSILYSDDTTSATKMFMYDINTFNSKVFNLSDTIFEIDSSKEIKGIQLLSFKIHDTVITHDGIAIASEYVQIRPIFNSLFAVIEV